MGGGSGRASETVLPLLPLLLLLLATHASCTPLPSVSPAPAPAPQPGVAGGGLREVQYTLDLLPQPASTETEDREDPRLTSQATVEAQLLPWAVGAATGGGPGCIKADVALRAAHLALQHQPPPAGVSVVVLPPPPDFPCTERHGVEYLLMQMTSPSTRVLIGGVEPGLCRVANHLARKYNKLFISWSCLEIPAREVEPPTSLHTTEEETQVEQEETDDSETDQVEDDSVDGEGDGEGRSEGSHVAMVTPTALQVAWAVQGALKHLEWRHVSIITLDWNYWRGVAHILDVELRATQHLVAALAVLPPAPSDHNITHVYTASVARFVKAYLLVIPASSGVVGRLLMAAEAQGITRQAAFLLLDPLYAPTPKQEPTHAHTPVRESSQLQIPAHLHPQSEEREENIQYVGLEQLNSISMPREAARAVMVLAASTRGPRESSTITTTTRGQQQQQKQQHQQYDALHSSSHPSSRHGHHARAHGDGETSPSDDNSQQERNSGHRRVILPQPPSPSAANQSESSPEERVVGRLVYDSVSLLSHILRTNVGTVRLRKKSNTATNTTSEEPRSRKVRPGEDMDSRRSGPSLSSLLHLTWGREAFNLARRETREVGEHRDREAERERLYFEVKTLNAARAGREFERRLESIIGSRGIAGPPGTDHRHTSSAHHNRSRLLEVRVTRPTYFPGMRGRGLVDTTGRRDFDFVLLDWRPSTGLLAPVLTLAPAPLDSSNTGAVVVVDEAEVDWAYDTRVAPDQDCGPAFCGYELAGVRLAPRYVVMIILCLLFLLAACCGCAAVLRKRLRQKEMSRGPYKILLTSSDLTLSSRPENAPRKPGSGAPGDRPDLLRGSLNSPQRPTPHDSLLSTASHAAGRDSDDAKAKYNGDFVHVKYFFSHSGNFEVKNRTMTLLKQMRDLRHENVNGFLGMLCDQLRPGLVFEYCSRRSLEDIIKKEDIKLDWSFRLSLLTDLVRGMRHLHGSLLRHHGRLTSRNCVIDARWVLKITDYGLPGIHEYQNLSRPNRPLRDLLWKAPELLRDESLMLKGTQTGDVFSFAIIMQEVVVRGAPYCMIQLSTQEILARLKKPPPMIRPSVSKGAAPPDAINIMKQCWAELPEMRPDFNQINDLFKKLNQGRRLNIVDTMFHMLEKYSSNLEELIKDRTEQLDIEKKKTEQLLNRMLPSSVADQLKLGMPVAPEEFEEVTIYFSDIVGFTTISAYSTPFEVVDLLNDLYTAFDSTINHYNVYKVETIGDAYMVVGGAPKKIDDHASQIATMALDLLHLSGKFRIRHLHNISLMLRIGIHTGPCCAGVVGMTMPRYCLFGDTVNTASRMESTGSAWRIHVSEKTWSVLQEEGGYHLEYRGLTKIKGKGEMETYWLLGKDGFKKELPVPPELGNTHGLDEELIRQGRQHYMNRRDSAVESLITAKGFSSIQAARMQSEPRDGQLLEGEEEWAATSCSTGNSLMTPPTGLGLMDSLADAGLSPHGEDDQLLNFVSNNETMKDRTSSENSCTVVKEVRKNSKDKGNSTKSSSKCECVQNKSQSTVPKVMCDSGVVPRKKSRERCDFHQMDKQTSGVSKSTVPSEGAIRENHISLGSEIELDTSYYCDVTLRNHTPAEGAHMLVPKSNSLHRSHLPSEDTDELAPRTSSFSLGPRQDFHRGPIISRTASPPLLCHNKVFPQYGTAASPVRECTRSTITSPAGSWGHGLSMPWQQQQHQEVVGTRPTTLQGVTIEYQVHSNPHDLPSPTESTML